MLVNSIILTILLAVGILGFRFYWSKAWSKNPEDRKYFRPSRDKSVRRSRGLALMYLVFGIYAIFNMYRSGLDWYLLVFAICVSLTLIWFNMNQAKKLSAMTDAQWDKMWDPEDSASSNATDPPQ